MASVMPITRPTGPEPIRIVTWNIRYGFPADERAVAQDTEAQPLERRQSETPEEPERPVWHDAKHADPAALWNMVTLEQPWEERRDGMIAQLLHIAFPRQPVFIGLQEVLVNQLADIISGLNRNKYGAEFRYIGVGRDDGYMRGEFSPILYDASQVELVGETHFWLSERPTVPGSRGWGAGSSRICQIGHFRIRKSGRRICVINAHLDDKSAMQRSQGAQMIYAQMEAADANEHVIVTGDFNSEPDDGAYQQLTAQAGVYDALLLADTTVGHVDTFTGFAPDVRRKRIDYVFVHDKPGKTGGNGSNPSQRPAVAQFAVYENRFDDKVYLSDHRAVVVDMLVQ